MSHSMPTVGVVPTMADLYRRSNPALPAQYLDHWRPVLEELLDGAAVIHWAGVSCTREEVSAGVAACERAGCVLLMVLPLAYAPSGAAAEPLRSTRLPLLLISSARDATIPASATGGDLRANQAVHGVQDLANVLWRQGRGFHVVAGHPEQKAFRHKLKRAVEAAAAAATLRLARVGRLGQPMSGMLDLSYDSEAQARLLGFSVVPISPDDLEASAKQTPATVVAELAGWVRAHMVVDAGVTAEELLEAARACAGLERLVKSMDLQALAMNFLDVVGSGARTLPFLGASRLMARGIGYAGEGDVLTAALSAALVSVAGEATFTEMFCADFRRGEVLLSHMGEANLAMADPDRPVHLRAKPNEWGGSIRPLAPVFQFRAGPVSLFSLSEGPCSGSKGGVQPGAHFQLVGVGGDIVAGPEQPRLSNPYSYFRPHAELPGFLEEYSRTGGTHHLAMVYGDHREIGPVLADYCGLTYRELST